MPVEQDVTVLVQEFERIKPDAGELLQGCELGIRPPLG